MSDNTTGLIPEPVQQLLTLFEEHLNSISFPDVSLEIIKSLAEKVESAQKEVEEAQKHLETAQEALSASSDELLQKCMRGLAYAKVYADGQEELSEKLQAIHFGKPTRIGAKRSSAAEKTKEDASTATQSRKKRSAATAEQREDTAAA